MFKDTHFIHVQQQLKIKYTCSTPVTISIDLATEKKNSFASWHLPEKKLISNPEFYTTKYRDELGGGSGVILG